MELQSPLGLEVNEQLINSNQTTPENNTIVTKIDFNQNQIENLTIEIPFNFEITCSLCIIDLLDLYTLQCFFLCWISSVFIYYLCFFTCFIENFIFCFN